MTSYSQECRPSEFGGSPPENYYQRDLELILKYIFKVKYFITYIFSWRFYEKKTFFRWMGKKSSLAKNNSLLIFWVGVIKVVVSLNLPFKGAGPPLPAPFQSLKPHTALQLGYPFGFNFIHSCRIIRNKLHSLQSRSGLGQPQAFLEEGL